MVDDASQGNSNGGRGGESSSSPETLSQAVTAVLKGLHVLIQAPVGALLSVLKSFSSFKVAKPPEASNEELNAIVNRNDFNPGSVELFYEKCKAMYDDEAARTRSIDSKAMSLASLIGGSLAGLFGVALLLVQDSDKMAVASIPIVGVLYIGCVFVLLVAASVTILAWRVRRFRGHNEENVFHVVALANPEVYKKFMATDFWKMGRDNSKVNTSKVISLKWAQAGYFLFLVCFVILCVVLVYHVL